MVLQPEIDARMDEALTEMAIERAEIIIFIQQGAEIAQIPADVIRRNSGIFPAFPRVRLIRHTRAGAEPRITNFPDDLFMFWVVNESHRRWIRLRLQLGHELPRRLVRFLSGLATKLDQQPAFAFGQDLQVARMNVLQLHRMDEHVVDAFEADRSVFANFRDMIACVMNVRITEHE